MMGLAIHQLPQQTVLRTSPAGLPRLRPAQHSLLISRRSVVCQAGLGAKDPPKASLQGATVKEAPSVGNGNLNQPETDAPLRVSLSQPGTSTSNGNGNGNGNSNGSSSSSSSGTSASSSRLSMDSLGGPAQSLRVAWRRLTKELSSLPRAIAIMFTIAGLSGLGTIIPQNKPIPYYMENYPDLPGQKVLGFLDYHVLLGCQFDHIYTAWYFYLSLGLLAASLMACTYTRQWPAVKVAQRWRFMKTPAGVVKMGNAEVLPNARLPDLGLVLREKGYQVFVQDKSLYAFKGLAGRIGPIGVHAALLLVLGGTSYSGLGGFKGSVMCPEGGDFVIGSYMRPASAIASLPASAGSLVHVDDFTIDYRPDGSVAQFYSTLTVKDDDGQEVTKRISVNDPLRYRGITMYQTDWSLAAVQLHVQEPRAAPPLTSSTPSITPAAPSSPAGAAALSASPSPAAPSPSASPSPSPSPTPGPQPGFYPPGGQTFSLPMASLEGKPGIAGRLWASFLPLSPPGQDGSAPRGVSVLARDPQSVVLYDAQGKFVGVRRPDSGKPIELEGIQLVVDGVVGSTGLEIKNDPGVPWVYAGFGGLMITTLVSYLSHSQVWAVQEGAFLYVSGRTNRAVVSFEKELDEVLEAVPELPATAT